MVGEEAAVGEDQELSWMERLGNRRYCLRLNLPLIMAEVANMPEEQVIAKLRAGTLKINDALIKKMDFAEEDEWFCKICPAPAGSGGNPLLMTAPSSLLECPGCSSISVVPNGGSLFYGLCHDIVPHHLWDWVSEEEQARDLQDTYREGGSADSLPTKVHIPQGVLGGSEVVFRAAV